MTQTAVVREKLPGGRAAVEVMRPTSCGKACSSCGLCAAGAPLRVTVRDPLGTHVGDVVTVASSSRSVLGLAGLVYMLPIVLFFLGCATGPLLGLPEAAGGVIAFALSLLPVIWVGRRLRRRGGVEVTIMSYAENR